MQMHHSSRRQLLREATAPVHRALEAIVGPIDSLLSYSRYLKGLSAFRAPIEARFPMLDWPSQLGEWRPTGISSALATDLADLGLVPIEPAPCEVPTDAAGLIGTLYVLEGSSLGARLIYREAQQLGLDEQRGARHLALQARSDTWRGFTAILDHAPALNCEHLADAANNAFRAAHAAMLKAQDADPR